MTKRIVTNSLKTHIIDQLIESITEPANTAYYAFAGDHVTKGVTEEEINNPDSSIKTLKLESFRNMIFGKKIENGDMRFLIPKYEWTENSIYDMYDDEDINLYNKRFFVMVDETSYKHVYKCIDNANNNPSMVKPTFSDISINPNSYNISDSFYETADGYVWKYMYSIDSNTFMKFNTQDYIPIVSNNVIEKLAIPGTIEVIKTDTHGKYYNNYISGQFNELDISTGNTVQYRLRENASTVRDFYSNTILYLTSGTGAGQYRRIVESYVYNTSTYVETESSFDVTPDITTKYEITPEVRVYGDGNQTVNVSARAIINSVASNSIHKVEILRIGERYNYATAEVLQGVPAGVNNLDIGELVLPEKAIVRPILSPSGGHGSNTAVELGAKTLCIYTKFANTESGRIPTENTFSQFGIIRDPLFANVQLNVLNSSDTPGYDGAFSIGEECIQIKRIKVSSNSSVNTNVITIDNGSYLEDCVPGEDLVFIEDTASTSLKFISKISSINGSTIIMEEPCHWISDNCDVYLSRKIASGIINDIRSTYITMNEVVNNFTTDRLIIGTSSYSTGKVDSIDINNKYNNAYSFKTFTQAMMLVGSFSSGSSFNQDEIVYQGDVNEPSCTAYVYSSNSSHVKLTRVNGNIDNTLPLIGSTSESILSSNFNKYLGDLDPTSGSVIYLQNDIPISRAEDQSEEIRVLLEF